ncbi:serine hydrolase FSH [Fusarium mundagurra]|uniref:Serine hydrolase FSH n=1 Tax=Fusarium mundagurra TaxID=1567541 RepID=A0A8H5YQ81_9HYPO|nr:serine hydrolase FSH [Fusarium mundagurra]
MRILCLHGMGTNSKVLEMQTSALRHQLSHSQSHKYEYVDGGEPMPPAPGIEAFIGDDESLAYYHPHSAKSILTAIDDLWEYIAEEGPFDGVLGFSQGASLAAMIIARARHSNPPPFQFAIFFCAGLPYCEKSLSAGEVKFLRLEDTQGPVIHVPTAHIFGKKDPDVSYSKAMTELCHPWGRVLLDHGAGHEIPRVPVEIVDDMARAVEKVVTKAVIGQ